MKVNALTQALTTTSQTQQSGHADISPTIRLTGPDRDTVQFAGNTPSSVIEPIEALSGSGTFRKFVKEPVEISTIPEKAPSGFFSSLVRNFRKFLSQFSVKQYEGNYGKNYADAWKYSINSGN